jgi:putative tryptophan/tyrosine transport system substrate-binding protein
MRFNQLKRREFITLLGGAAAWPLAARAQQPDRLRRIGVLLLGNAGAEYFQTELREGLRKSDYIDGRNIQFEVRSANEKPDLLPSLAAELVALKVDVIVALFTPSALAAKRATSEIPIVFLAGDAVGTGVVPSLARPAGNLTGLSVLGAELQGKCVELLHDMLPSVRRVAALGYAADPFSKSFVDQVQLAGSTSRIEIDPILMLQEADEIDAAFAAMAKARVDAAVISATFATQHVADLALKYRVAAATNQRAFAEAGGLMSYGYNAPDLYRRVASFVLKVLQGNKPANIPVEQPTRFELVVNLKTAKALGLAISESFLLRADEVID